METSGYLLALFASLLWGVSGTCAQFLFQTKGLTPEWLVCVRMLISGIVLLALPAVKNPSSITGILRNKKDTIDLLMFSIFGMILIQYSYFAAINLSNAATATVLQYIGPIFIVLYYAFIEKKIPTTKELFAVLLAVAGTFLLVTHGNVHTLLISPLALFWGIVSALALATYSILPIRLLNKYDTTVVLGWGMVLGGFLFSLFYHPWIIPGEWDLETYLALAFVVLMGSALAFFCYMNAVKKVGATVTSLLACAEPLSAAVIAVVWLNVSFVFYDWAGMVAVILAIFILTKKTELA